MFSRKTYLIIWLAFLVFSTFSLSNGQSLPEKIEMNPVVLFNRARDYVAQNKHREARQLLEKLLELFPNDFEIRGLFLETVKSTEDLKIYTEQAGKAVDLYDKVSPDERTERFYEIYRTAARDSHRFKELFASGNELVRKFPNSRLGKNLRLGSAIAEKDFSKASKVFEELEVDFKDADDAVVYFTNYFVFICGHLDKFETQKVIEIAEKTEKTAFDKLNREKKDLRNAQFSYLSIVMDIANLLREKFPADSLRFAQKGAAIFDKTKIAEGLQYYKLLFRQAVFRSYVAAKDWKNAQRKGLELIKWAETSSPEEDVDEARLRRDYALALKNLKQIALAREQFYIASILSKDFNKDWKEFDLKFPLSPTAKQKFEVLAKSKFESFLASRETVIKRNLLKTEQKTQANNFILRDLGGKEVSLKDFQGKVLILGFWATWCLPCVGELEQMKIAFKKYGDNPRIGFAFVSTDTEREKVPLEVKNRNYEFPIFYANENIERDYQIEAIPQLFIIDAQGNIRFQRTEFNNNGYYLKELDWMLEAVLR